MRVWPAAVGAGEARKSRDMQALANKLGADVTIEPWDYRYYQEKVRKAKYDLGQDEMKPYFELTNMINGMFWAAGQLYGLDFKENTGTVPVFHPDVRTFEVTDRASGKVVGLFYLDNYRPRRASARAPGRPTYRSRVGLLGDEIVLASNNNNFTKPAAGRAGADQPRRRRDPVPRVRPRHPLSAGQRPLSGPRRHRSATSSNIRAR